MISRKTNRRHMTGDHHSRTAGRATLLVRAVDEILGTHNGGQRRCVRAAAGAPAGGAIGVDTLDGGDRGDQLLGPLVVADPRRPRR
jgi:hypothetical protein